MPPSTAGSRTRAAARPSSTSACSSARSCRARRSSGHVERFRAATAARLEEYRRIEPRNTREGADRFHWFELHRAIERAEGDVAWADWVLEELERG